LERIELNSVCSNFFRREALPELEVLLITHRIDLMKGNPILYAIYSVVPNSYRGQHR